MNMQTAAETVQKQREFFLTHGTKDVSFRKKNLEALLACIQKYEGRILEALHADLHKHPFEAYGTEIGIVLEELKYQIRHLHRFARPKRKFNNLLNFPGTSQIIPQPYGVVLVMAPWNYPFQLLMNPLIGAMAAGNCVVLKPADYSRNTGAVMAAMIRECFDEKYVAVFTGGREVNSLLLEERYDAIFFTGSPSLGKIVMEKAARYLTPVILELGGKSPCIVDQDANIEVAARRIIFGKFLNAGQTCIAPDYLFVHKSMKDRLLEAMKACLTRFYTADPMTSPSYGRIINARQFERLTLLMACGTIYSGGRTDAASLYIEPTLLVDVKPEDPVMNEEIFGPVFPVMEFNRIDTVIDYINRRERPLAFYYFSESRQQQQDILNRTTAGGSCINDTMMHLSDPALPFGGVGNSGMGRYHGKYSFDAFSHFRSVLKKSTRLDIPIRYAPYTRWGIKLLKLILG
jgi:aldehyde dehydrogenase (NAD+)